VAGQSKRIGRSLMHVLENASAEHLELYLAQPDENFAVVSATLSNLKGEETSPKDMLVEALSKLSIEDLQPVEAESQRIFLLAEGKGPGSCPPVLKRHLSNEDFETWDSQPDDLCRAIWLHVNHRKAFDDCVAFRNAREWRKAEHSFSALEVPLDDDFGFVGDDVPEDELLSAIQKKLKLSKRCGISVIDLPKNNDYPASVMAIVRHGGRQSSVAEHPDDGSRRLHYFLPQDEVVLIFTPSSQRLEVCAQTAEVRSAVSETFAKVALKHDISSKPLTWANYDTSRFLQSLELDAPEVPGFMIERAAVTEIELRVGQWEHRLKLRVPFRDDISQFVEQTIGHKRVLRRALGVSRIAFSIKFTREGHDVAELLEFAISDRNRCNLSANVDAALRWLGRALLSHWGVMQPFRDLDHSEIDALLPILAELFDLGENKVSAQFLEKRGVDPTRLVQAGLLVRHSAEPILVEDIDAEQDPPSQDSRIVYQVKHGWLEQRLVDALQGLIDDRPRAQADRDVVKIGSASFGEQSVPCYLCRGLSDTNRYMQADGRFRLDASALPGIVFTGKEIGWEHVGPHVVIPIVRSGSLPTTGSVLSLTDIEAAFRTGLAAALGAEKVSLESGPRNQLILKIPGKARLPIDGEHQQNCVRLLVEDYLRGGEGVATSDLLGSSSSKSVGQLFGTRWDAIKDIYIRNVRRKFWALSVQSS
jgi:hypothetical protein